MSVPKNLTLCQDVRLHISIIVLAGPHKGARGLQDLGNHIINKSVLIPDLQFVKLRLVVPVKKFANASQEKKTLNEH